jgi:hypothetical protein
LSPDWISALGTVAAVVTALWLATRADRKDRAREERHQAEQLTAWFVPYEGKQDDKHKLYVGLCVTNASNQLFYDVIAQVVSVQGAFRNSAVGDADERNHEFAAMVGNVPPGEVTTRINTGGRGMHLRLGIELAFKDAGGRFWLRHANGTLERVEQHPVELYNLSRPLSWEN